MGLVQAPKQVLMAETKEVANLTSLKVDETVPMGLVQAPKQVLMAETKEVANVTSLKVKRWRVGGTGFWPQ